MVQSGDLGVSHEPEEFLHEGVGDTVSTRVMELVVAGVFMLVAMVVMADSWRVGAGWASDGPQAGYFPFYIGLIMFVSSAITFLVHALTKQPDLTTFVKRSKLWLVLKVLVPTAVFVVLIGFLGIYLAAAIFIAFFMSWLGRYSLFKAVPVGVAVSLALFWLFEIMFLIPLPGGPLEALLGF